MWWLQHHLLLIFSHTFHQVLLVKVFRINFITRLVERRIFFCSLLRKFLQVSAERATIFIPTHRHTKLNSLGWKYYSLSQVNFRRYNYYHNFFSLNFYRRTAQKKRKVLAGENFLFQKEKLSFLFLSCCFKILLLRL